MQSKSQEVSDPSVASLCNSTGSKLPKSSLTKILSLKMDSPQQQCPEINRLCTELEGKDQSSPRSTGQSNHKGRIIRESNPNGLQASTQSGDDETYWREGHMQSVPQLRMTNSAFPSSHVDYGRSMAHISYPYADQQNIGSLGIYGPHAFVHPQMVGSTTRVMLPHEFAKAEPMYVNAKQYHAILRRRQTRAKLEAQNKLLKDRKPYLHESRHLHALKRARGSGGRFLNRKMKEKSKSTDSTDDRNASETEVVRNGGNVFEYNATLAKTGNMACSTQSCSHATSNSNTVNFFGQQNSGVSSYPTPSHMAEAIQNGGRRIVCNGSQRRVSVIQ